MLYSDIVPLIYVNEIICTAICPSTRFKSIILLPRMTCMVPKLSQNTSYGSEAWCHFLSLKTFLSFINRRGEGDDRGWDGWMASLTQLTWVWVNSGNWWWTGRPGVLRFMGSQRVGQDWATDLIWSEWLYNIQIKTSRVVPFLLPSDVYVRSFLYLLYTLIKLYYTKALSDQA